jgi:hypothetical protein
MSDFTNKAAGITEGDRATRPATAGESCRQRTADEARPTPTPTAVNPFLSGNFAPVAAE